MELQTMNRVVDQAVWLNGLGLHESVLLVLKTGPKRYKAYVRRGNKKWALCRWYDSVTGWQCDFATVRSAERAARTCFLGDPEGGTLSDKDMARIMDPLPKTKVVIQPGAKPSDWWVARRRS
jgi:hypothetical protein